MRERRRATVIGETESVSLDDTDVKATKVSSPAHAKQYAIVTTLSDLAKACHLRVDDTGYALSELGFLRHRRDFVPLPDPSPKRAQRETDPIEIDDANVDEEEAGAYGEDELGRWANVEVVISRDMVDQMWSKWSVREQGMLDESCVLL